MSRTQSLDERTVGAGCDQEGYWHFIRAKQQDIALREIYLNLQCNAELVWDGLYFILDDDQSKPIMPMNMPSKAMMKKVVREAHLVSKNLQTITTAPSNKVYKNKIDPSKNAEEGDIAGIWQKHLSHTITAKRVIFQVRDGILPLVLFPKMNCNSSIQGNFRRRFDVHLKNWTEIRTYFLDTKRKRIFESVYGQNMFNC